MMMFEISNLTTNQTVGIDLGKEVLTSENELRIELNVSGDRMDTLYISVPPEYLRITPEFVSGWLRINGYSPTTRVSPEGTVIIEFSGNASRIELVV